jgi:hypothetical protein
MNNAGFPVGLLLGRLAEYPFTGPVGRGIASRQSGGTLFQVKDQSLLILNAPCCSKLCPR